MAIIDSTGIKGMVSSIGSSAGECAGLAVVSGGFGANSKAKAIQELAASFFG